MDKPAIVVLAIVMFGAACDVKKSAPTGPTPPVQRSCVDSRALNYGGPAPCVYPPDDVVRLGYVGWPNGLRPNFGPSVGVGFTAPYSSGVIEAEIRIDGGEEHAIYLALADISGSPWKLIKRKEFHIRSFGVADLPHDITECEKCGVIFENPGAQPIPSGEATVYYRRNR